MEYPASMNDMIDKQTFEEMTRFDPSPDIRSIMVTGGNGFMYVAVHLDCVCLTAIAISIFSSLFRAKRNEERGGGGGDSKG